MTWIVMVLVAWQTACLAAITGDGVTNKDGELAKKTEGVFTKGDGVCSSIDIRNGVENFKYLNGCRVIEGYLQIVLLEHSTPDLFENKSFPELREVTGYVIFYRVNGLRSIGQLFPNLSLIRGERLFIDYALLITQMPVLREIGLVGLTTVLRGSVALFNNPELCFTDTVDWSRIVKGEPFLYRKTNLPCPACPKSCPTSCWNSTHCQVIDKVIAEAECNEQCIAGCTGPGPHQCTACKHLLRQGVCTNTCDDNEFTYQKRHCVTEEKCKNMTFSGIGKRFTLEESRPWFTWDRTCIQNCPKDFERDEKKGCRKCSGACRKVCPGLVVDSTQSAQTLEFCTHITGNLEIQIQSNSSVNITDELDKFLGLIEEIEGYLKVIRSFPLVNLYFFRNLRVIRGLQTSSTRKELLQKDNPPHNYAFRVLDNPNLQELFDWNRPARKNFTIENGRIFFHLNPKLCLKYVEEFIQITNITNITDLEVDKTFNEKMFACNVKNISVYVSVKTSNSFVVGIKSDILNISSSEQDWVRVLVYYKKAPSMNVTSHYDDNVCKDDDWKFNDFKTEYGDDGDGTPLIRPQLITQLEPFTQYAYYVRTYSLGSPIHYVRTLPTKPSSPENLQGYSDSSDKIIFGWLPPSHPNGLLKEYIIRIVLLEDDQDLPKFRNYCANPAHFPGNTTPPPDFKTIIKEDKSKELTIPKMLCDQSDFDKFGKISESFLQDHHIKSCERFMYSIINENVLKPKFSSRSKERRSTKKANENTRENKDDEDVHTFGKNGTTFNTDGTIKTETIPVSSNVTSYTLTNLMHFGRYLIEIKVCREKAPEEDMKYFLDSQCSDMSFITYRTLKSYTADLVDQNSIVIQVTNKSAIVKWKKPSSYNGVILNYILEYKKIDEENPNLHFKATECIVAFSNKSSITSFALTNLNYGEYAVKIQTISLAGKGPFSGPINFYIVDDSYSNWMEKLAVIIVVTLICIVGALLSAKGMVYYYQKKLKETNILIETINPEYTSVNGYIEDDWELSRDDIVLVNEIKQGNFGMVYEGLLLPENRKVAVKTVKETAPPRDNYDFLNEANVMKAFSGAHHVVKLLGVVSKGTPALVVMELMVLGDLKSFLRLSRDSPQYPPPSPSRLNLMAAQISDGMVYLEALKFVHRDLAARNCMVSEDLTVKIGDFGMTRDIYDTDYYRKGNKGLLPIRWMAPESLNDGVFTSFSDVWSFGVVLWEMVTLATQPYQGMSNEEVLQHVISGNKLDTPVYCPPLLKMIMLSCWKWKPKLRPTFVHILNLLDPTLNNEFRSNSYYHSVDRERTRLIEADDYRDNEHTSLLLLPSSSSVEFHPSNND